MNEGLLSLNVFFSMVLLELFLLFLSLKECHCGTLDYLRSPASLERELGPLLPEISPNAAPQPFLPLLAPSPLAPYTNSTTPVLSGQCALNFTAAESMMNMTSTDCWAFFAPLLANVMCCPQLEATLTILIGQSSKRTNELALNETVSKHCLSDVEQILVGQGAAENLRQVCTIHPADLSEGSCPVKDVNEFESTVDSSKLLADCGKIDPVKECCTQVCQNAILEAATTIALKASEVVSMDESQGLPQQSKRINDCKRIVVRWLASKLEHSRAKEVLRVLSNCNVNRACPLVFPDMKTVAKGCGNGITNQALCCNAMDSYVSHLQKQSLITNLQALNCATTLGMKLQRLNVTKDVFSLCRLSLKDFSLQVAKQESGCLLPSLPSDATFDKTSGISFICDLNDNIPAPWPSSTQLMASSCNKTVKIPALPAVASAQSGLYDEHLRFYAMVAVLTAAVMVL